MISRILVPLDGSELAGSVLPHVRELAKALDAKVHLVQVIEVSVPPDLLVSGTVPIGLVEAMFGAEETNRKQAEAYLSRLAARLQADGLSTSWAVVDGGEADKIVDEAYSEMADIIAMSTNGRVGLGRAVPGGVVEQVLQDAGMPVLLVKPSDWGSERSARAQ